MTFGLFFAVVFPSTVVVITLTILIIRSRMPMKRRSSLVALAIMSHGAIVGSAFAAAGGAVGAAIVTGVAAMGADLLIAVALDRKGAIAPSS